MKRYEEIYWRWVDNEYNNQQTAHQLKIAESSVRARVSEFLSDYVPKFYHEGFSCHEIQQMLKLPDDQRIKSRITNTPKTTTKTTHYPKRETRYSDIQDALPLSNIPSPLTITGDCIVTGDWQLPTTDFEFMKRVLHVGLLFLSPPRKLVICGDFLNGDGFSTYPKLIPQPSFTLEIKAGKRVIEDMLQVFDEIYITQGNHEDRVPKRTDAELTAEMVFSMITTDSRVIVSPHSHIDIVSSGETYRAMHALNYSVNQTKVAESMAWKELKHIIQHHEHHLAIGYDRYKNFITINNGGIFNQDYMGYVKMRKTKHANMANGFTLIKDGSPTLFGKYPYTNWKSIDRLVDSIIHRLPDTIKDVI